MIGLIKQQKPLISVIVPVYNVEKYLKNCVDSLICQSYPNLEIILVDDGSPDSCPEICDSFEKEHSNIRVIHKENGGLSSARNAGIDIARGEYIGFVDSDDTVFPDMYETLYDLIKDKNRAIACVSTVSVDAEGNENTYLRHSDESINTEDYLIGLLMFYGDCSAWSKLFSREIFHGKRFRDGRLNEDVLFMFESADKFDTVFFSSVIGYRYYMRGGSISRAFGKAVHDMVTNAHEIRLMTEKSHPSLAPYAERFEIYQNMSFVKNIPPDHDRSSDPMCAQTLDYIRKNRIRAYKNPYLSKKDKVILTALCIAPKATSRFFYKRRIRQ